LEVIDKNRIFAKIFYKNEYQPINSQDYDQAITQPQQIDKDHHNPSHYPTIFTKHSQGRRNYNI
jgi:hypothetical protein